MLIDELLSAVGFENDDERIKAADDALELIAVGQEDGQRQALLACLIQKNVLKIDIFIHYKHSFSLSACV